jgi:TIR domain/NB-ARC domain/WD domain, G-beta repeat
MAFDLFLSYARDDDAAFVARLYERLTRKGRRVWWDREHMPSRGTTFLQEIREAIAGADRLAVVLGPAALTSEYVRAEWQYALSLSKPVTPLLCGIGANQLPPELRLFHAPDTGGGEPSRRTWAEIDRVLAEPPPPLAVLDGVPRTPPRFQPPPEIEALTGLLLGEQQRVENPRPDDQVAAVAGLAGSGKSVLAAALARLTPVRRTFAEICWVNAGPAYRRDAAEERAVALRARIASDAAILVVLDDVWSLEPIEPFLDALGPRSRVLLTTRHAWIAGSLGARSVTAGGFAADAGLAFLAAWVDRDVRELPAAARTVVRQCAGLPLALAMAGALAHDGVPWADIGTEMEEARLEFLAAPLPNYPYPSLAATLAISVRGVAAQSPQAAAVLRQLAVFEAEIPVPTSLVEAVAAVRLGMSPIDTRRALTFLAARSLAVLGTADVALHSLVLSFVREGALAAPAAQRDLVAAFATLGAADPDGRPDWCTLPDDGYLWQHLVHHMLGGEQVQETGWLLGGGDWPRERVARSGVTAAIADLDQYVAAADPPDPDVAVLTRALRASAHVLRHDPGQYQLQLAIRLGGDPRLAERFCVSPAALPPGVPRPANPGTDVPADVRIAQSAERQASVRCGLVTLADADPVCVTGDSAGRVVAVEHRTGQVRFIIDGHEDDVRAVAASPERSLLATGSGYWLDVHTDCSIKLWDLSTGEAIATLSATQGGRQPDAHSEPIGDLLFTDGGRTLISASWDRTVGIWDVATGRRTHTLAGHDQGLNTAGLTADGRFVVSGAAGGEIGIWELPAGELRLIRDLEAGPPVRIRAMPGGSWVACLTYDQNLLVVEIPSGEIKHGYAIPGACAFLVMDATTIRVARDDGGVIDVDVRDGKIAPVCVFPEDPALVHFGVDPRWVAASSGSRTAHYDLAVRRPADDGAESDRTTLGAVPAENPDKVLVVRRNGTVLAWSVPDAAEIGRRQGPGPVLTVQRIPGGVITRSKDLFVWWAAGARRPRITRRAPTRLDASEAALVSRELGVSWNMDPWTFACTWRLDDNGDLLSERLIGRPRELDPFLEPQYMEAPHKAGGYYTLATVDYASDRFALAPNGMEGIVFVDRDGRLDHRLAEVPYGRYAADNALLPESSFYVEAYPSGVRVWDLRTDMEVAGVQLPEGTVDVGLDARGQAVWTIDKGGQLRRLDLPALTESFHTHLSLIGDEPALCSAGAHDRVAVVDEHLNLYLVNTARGAPSCPVGLNSPAVGCVFTSDGCRVLVAQRNGDVLILDLPD